MSGILGRFQCRREINFSDLSLDISFLCSSLAHFEFEVVSRVALKSITRHHRMTIANPGHHLLRHNHEELRRAQHLLQVADDAQVRPQDAQQVRTFIEYGIIH